MIRVQDLQDQIGMSGPRPILYCPSCGGEFSANRGDYFWAAPGDVLRCQECDTEFQLATKATVYREVSQ